MNYHSELDKALLSVHTEQGAMIMNLMVRWMEAPTPEELEERKGTNLGPDPRILVNLQEWDANREDDTLSLRDLAEIYSRNYCESYAACHAAAWDAVIDEDKTFRGITEAQSRALEANVLYVEESARLGSQEFAEAAVLEAAGYDVAA